ncbi:MAG: hypothetical protein IBJ19_16390 [Gemmatimonadaceae bacterium]|nr:hypothetical protein [Gemmatimonadaceae bacterium]
MEARRGGERAGRLAVGAEGVRALGVRGVEAARATASLVEQAVQRVEGGVQISVDVGQQWQDVRGRIALVQGVMTQIDEATLSQQQGMHQMRDAIVALSAAVQQAAASAQESASAAQELTAQAQTLGEQSARFEADGSSAGSRARRTLRAA